MPAVPVLQQESIGAPHVGSERSQTIDPGDPSPVQRKISIGEKELNKSKLDNLFLKELNITIESLSPMGQLVLNEMLSSGTHSFTGFTVLMADLTQRISRIEQLEQLNNDEAFVFSEGVDISLPTDYWRPAKFDKKGEAKEVKEGTPIIWESKPGVSASLAVMSLTVMEKPPDETFKLDCQTAVQIADYFAVLCLLGVPEFNKLFDKPILIGLNGVKSGGREPLQSEKIQENEREIASEQELVAGDRVYFVNHLDYCLYDPNGNWAGEHAIYKGGGKFIGFGVSEMTSVEMKAKLEANYQKAKLKGKKAGEEQDLETLNDEYPGIYVMVNGPLLFTEAVKIPDP